MSVDDDHEIEINISSSDMEDTRLSPGFGDASGSGTAPSGSLLADDEALVVATAKANALEAFLRLLCHPSSFNDFVSELLFSIQRAVPSEEGSILEVDPQGKALFFRAVTGRNSEVTAQFSIPMGQGIVGYVAESRQPLVVNEPKECKVHLKSVSGILGVEPRNIIAIPIVIRGKVYGVLELLNRMGEAKYTATDTELLTFLCTAAAQAIEMRLMLGWAMQGAHKDAA